jgi:hypothetical protein
LPMRRLVSREGGRWAVLMITVLLASPLRAEQAATPASSGEESNSDLAEKTQNPAADLISVPFQNNFNFNTGPEKRSVLDLNIEPVIPIKLTDDWNLITRTILPIINQPPLTPGIDQATGLRDINPSFFLSPSGSKEFIWSIAPTFTSPTASNRLLDVGSGGPPGRQAHGARSLSARQKSPGSRLVSERRRAGRRATRFQSARPPPHAARARGKALAII